MGSNQDQVDRKLLKEKLHMLQLELKSGKNKLISLENNAEALRETLLRISGAIQVLEEILEDSQGIAD